MFLYNTSFINVDFPEPDTPVTQIKFPSGNLTVTFFRLCSVAPTISKYFPVKFLRFLGTAICILPLRYFPVIELSDLAISSAVPCARTYPPCTPAPGPMSITWSAAYIVSVSCSTTITEFPKSLNFFKVVINLLLSLWCNPIDGSSKIYITPVSPLPI